MLSRSSHSHRVLPLTRSPEDDHYCWSNPIESSDVRNFFSSQIQDVLQLLIYIYPNSSNNMARVTVLQTMTNSDRKVLCTFEASMLSHKTWKESSVLAIKSVARKFFFSLRKHIELSHLTLYPRSRGSEWRSLRVCRFLH